jgi:hypothetical protein
VGELIDVDQCVKYHHKKKEKKQNKQTTKAKKQKQNQKTKNNNHLNLNTSGFSGVHVVLSFVICVMFCKSLFVI